jgi:poly-gamma-glutamate synthesis protein (capsule biosynthesis protein)
MFWHFTLTPFTRVLLFACVLAANAMAEGVPPDGFTIAAGGDIIGPRGPLTEAFDTEFDRIAMLFRSADIGVANLEGALFSLRDFGGYPAAETGGGYPLYPMTLGDELRRMGILMVAKSNNHATDWGVDGLLATLDALATAGIVQAGTGPDPDAARAPAYIDTANGTVALVSTATT